MKTIIVYGSTTGTAEAVALDLAGAFSEVAVISAGEVAENDLMGVDLLILGASTWGTGDLQDDMDALLDQFSSWDVNVKTAAVFGVGDQFTYADTYVDGMADMAAALKNKAIEMVGTWSAEGYGHNASRAQAGDVFIGLALDQDNESDKTAGRIAEWAKQVMEEVGA
ncbi:flavodoxin domain-containing protein [Tichowtungia aerotolerans]|uniref:Flavodoxin n=1 Tax=Tichowtungia aerotolerans TaxID=2697043 RepID=A0A6P1MB14_9BACT|nr:flavodoxin domain-containing protein [Tichowtungia aerotolerans]QHI68305.1 flavodoxin [Tichowtungia aerotolerans]